MQETEEKPIRRSQRDYSLAFKLAVVGEVARGELSKKQAQRPYGIQGRSTVLVRCHPNLVKDAPKPTAPNHLYVSNITYLPTRQGTVYLRLVTDAFSRHIVGAHVHSSLHTTGCLAALAQAVHQTGAAASGCVHHSDCGSQYAPDAYQTALTRAGLRCSMTDGYDC